MALSCFCSFNTYFPWVSPDKKRLNERKSDEFVEFPLPHLSAKNHPHLWLGDCTKSVFTIGALGHVWVLLPLSFLQHRRLLSFFFHLFQDLQEAVGNNPLGNFGMHQRHWGSDPWEKKRNNSHCIQSCRCWCVKEPFDVTSVLLPKKPEQRQVGETGLHPSHPMADGGVCMMTRNHFSSIQVCSLVHSSAWHKVWWRKIHDPSVFTQFGVFMIAKVPDLNTALNVLSQTYIWILDVRNLEFILTHLSPQNGLCDHHFLEWHICKK